MSTKICSKCRITKHTREFFKQRQNKSGFKSQCKSCDKIYINKNKEMIADIQKAYQLLNHEKILAYRKKYYEANKEKIFARVKEWREENPNKLADIGRNSRHKRRALKAGDSGELSKGLFEKLFILQRGMCVACREKLSNTKPRSQMDHIIALANGGKNEDSNIQLLCRSCNGSKHARHPIDFMQSRGFLL